MSVLESVEHDLAEIAGRKPGLEESALAATAKQLARELDSSSNSATSKSMCAKSLMEAMDRLRALAPDERKKDSIDELAAKRAERRGAAAEG